MGTATHSFLGVGLPRLSVWCGALDAGADSRNRLIDRGSGRHFKAQVARDVIHAHRVERNAAAIDGGDEQPGLLDVRQGPAFDQLALKPIEYARFHRA